MADNYCQSSSQLNIPEDKIGRAQEIVDRAVKRIEEESEEEYCGCQVKVEEDGVWFHADESINLEHVEIIAKALVNELEIDAPFYCSWAFTCSKPRIDEFGGGAFVVKRGYKTSWVDAMSHVQDMVKCGKLAKE